MFLEHWWHWWWISQLTQLLDLFTSFHIFSHRFTSFHIFSHLFTSFQSVSLRDWEEPNSRDVRSFLPRRWGLRSPTSLWGPEGHPAAASLQPSANVWHIRVSFFVSMALWSLWNHLNEYENVILWNIHVVCGCIWHVTTSALLLVIFWVATSVGQQPLDTTKESTFFSV